MNLVETGMIACWALCAAGLAAYAASVAREIRYVTLADGRKTERRLPLIVRLLLPLAPNLKRFVSGRHFAAARAQADQMIVSGGLEGLLTGAEPGRNGFPPRDTGEASHANAPSAPRTSA